MNTTLAQNSSFISPDWPAPRRVRALCSTRAGGVSQGSYSSLNLGDHVGDAPAAVVENRRIFAAALQGAQPVFLQQVHGCDVLAIDAHTHQGAVADACSTQAAGVGCTIMVADCLPLVFCNAAGTQVAGAHAGWRGLAAGVLENTVAALCKAASCRPAEIHAWLGACIGPEAFEVGSDVRDAFRGDEALFVYRPNAAGEPRWRADLAGLARRRLLALGLSDVSGGGACTLTDQGPYQTSRFFSFRGERLGGPCGRMVAAIRLL